MLATLQQDEIQRLRNRVAVLESQSAEKQPFSEAALLDAIRTAGPGTRLNFGNVGTEKMEVVVRELSRSVDSPRVVDRNGFDLGQHVSQQVYWWGVRLEVSHEGMQALAAGGAATASMLTALGVTALVAVIIAGVIGIWSAFDRGNGVNFFVTWTGVHWFTTR